MSDKSLSENLERFKMIGFEIKTLVEESKQLRAKIAKEVQDIGIELNEYEFAEVLLDGCYPFRIKKALAHKDWTIIFGEKPAGIFPYEG